MGLLKKLKNIFYDEEVIEVPVQHKEEVKPKIEEVILPKREIVSEVKKEEPKKDAFSERELFKSETTFNFPIFEDEKEEKPKSRSGILDLEEKDYKTPMSSHRETQIPKVEPKSFRPSPVISPIYGILDKNYKKDEIVEKKEYTHTPQEMNYDYVRRKAYGTLEDELENTLTRIQEDTEEIDETVEKVTTNIQRSSDDIENLLTEIEKNATVSIGELEEQEKQKEDLEEEIEEQEKPPKKAKAEVNYDSTLEHDLFNLIDSMYEDKED